MISQTELDKNMEIIKFFGRLKERGLQVREVETASAVWIDFPDYIRFNLLIWRPDDRLLPCQEDIIIGAVKRWIVKIHKWPEFIKALERISYNGGLTGSRDDYDFWHRPVDVLEVLEAASEVTQ